jgi:hypothetical protein
MNGRRAVLPVGENVRNFKVGFNFDSSFDGNISNYAYNRMQQTLAAGLHLIWTKWHNLKWPTLWQAEVQALLKANRGQYEVHDTDHGLVYVGDKEPKALTMDTNLKTAFHLLGYGIAGSAICFVAEVVLLMARGILIKARRFVQFWRGIRASLAVEFML